MKKIQPSESLSLHSSQALLKNSLLNAVELNLKHNQDWIEILKVTQLEGDWVKMLHYMYNALLTYVSF